MDPQDAPDIVALWDRTHTARTEKLCAVCKEPIKPGEKYQTTGMTVDGQLEIWTRHKWGEMYPSGCPKLRGRDLAELQAEEQSQ